MKLELYSPTPPTRPYNIGIIIPDRGDRPELMRQCQFYVSRMIMNAQNDGWISSAHVAVMDYPAESDKVDITQRYKRGYDSLRNQNLDAIFFIENDDWYHENYLIVMLAHWEANNFPGIFGTDHTEYYHLRLRAHWTVKHLYRSSAMSTLIRPDLVIPWCPDHEPYTDVHLWNVIGKRHMPDGSKAGVIFKPPYEICIGMKHGIGLCGGRSHVDRLERYVNKDHSLEWLKSKIGDDVKFYERFGD